MPDNDSDRGQGHHVGKSFANQHGHEHTGMTITTPGVLDESGSTLPKIPAKGPGVTLPDRDPYAKYRDVGSSEA